MLWASTDEDHRSLEQTMIVEAFGKRTEKGTCWRGKKSNEGEAGPRRARGGSVFMLADVSLSGHQAAALVVVQTFVADVAAL